MQKIKTYERKESAKASHCQAVLAQHHPEFSLALPAPKGNVTALRHARALPLMVGNSVTWQAFSWVEQRLVLQRGQGHPINAYKRVWEAPCCQPRVPKRKEQGLLLHVDDDFLSRKEVPYIISGGNCLQRYLYLWHMEQSLA